MSRTMVTNFKDSSIEIECILKSSNERLFNVIFPKGALATDECMINFKAKNIGTKKFDGKSLEVDVFFGAKDEAGAFVAANWTENNNKHFIIPQLNPSEKKEVNTSDGNIRSILIRKKDICSLYIKIEGEERILQFPIIERLKYYVYFVSIIGIILMIIQIIISICPSLDHG